jgi:phosphate/sulfate permease
MQQLTGIKNKKYIPYISGLFFNLGGFLLGSNLLIQFISKIFVPHTEYQSYLLWCFSGLIVSYIGNVFGVIIFAPQNIKRTLIGSFAGLLIGIGLSFFPLLYIGGIVTIFIGTLLGHFRNKGNIGKYK